MPINALTANYKGITRIIYSDIEVCNTASNQCVSTKGIWDTGATASAITKKLANKLDLIPTGSTKVNGVHGLKDNVPVYGVKITLNNRNVSFTIPVTECEQLTSNDAAEFLIGMDVISKGDFSISNFNGNTAMSFRSPSVMKTDYVAGFKNHKPIISDKIPGRNDPCPCGSGKKSKHCCYK